MISNIIVGIMCVIVIAAGVFGWWWENGGAYQDSKKEEDKSESEDNETEGIAEDEKNLDHMHNRTGKCRRRDTDQDVSIRNECGKAELLSWKP